MPLSQLSWDPSDGMSVTQSICPLNCPRESQSPSIHSAGSLQHSKLRHLGEMYGIKCKSSSTYSLPQQYLASGGCLTAEKSVFQTGNAEEQLSSVRAILYPERCNY